MDTFVITLAATALVLLIVLVKQLHGLGKRLAEKSATEEQARQVEEARLETLLARTSEMLESKQRQLSENLRDAMGENQKRISDSVQGSLKNTTDTLNQRFAELTRLSERKLDAISGRVDERLNQGFEKTQKVFSDVLSRLAVIDKAQERIAKLSENVVSLQDILTDKRARGAFGEVQLHQLVRQVLPESAYSLQATLSNGKRADCLLTLPEPVGHMAIDAKFPLENYQRFTNPDAHETERKQALASFKQDVKKHIEDIAGRYIIPGETADGAIMFLPAEAIFAELHAHHPGLIEFAQKRQVWIASPTTMMAILTTMAAVLKDAETKRQVHIIQEHLQGLASDFGRFGNRFDNLARHIRQASEDTQQIHTSAKKISSRFAKIEKVDLKKEEIPPIDADQA